jgi:hypothetical protein
MYSVFIAPISSTNSIPSKLFNSVAICFKLACDTVFNVNTLSKFSFKKFNISLLPLPVLPIMMHVVFVIAQ